jgi:hypothetical protein
MCPGCVAYLASKVLILLLALALANVTDWKFGLWLLLATIAQIWIDCSAIYQSEPPPIHPALIFCQMLVLGWRGAKLLEADHWTKRLASNLAQALKQKMEGGSFFPEGWRKRLGFKSWEFGRRWVRVAALWTAGPVLCALTDFRSAIWLLMLAACLFGAHFEPLESETLSWGISYAPMWWPISLTGLAIVRGLNVFYRRKDHWLHQWLAPTNQRLQCLPDCPGCPYCAPWLVD